MEKMKTRDAETRAQRKERVALEKQAAAEALVRAEAEAKEAEDAEDGSEESVKKAEEAEAKAKEAKEKAEALEDEEAEDEKKEANLVVVNVPKKFSLRLDNDVILHFVAGVQDMDRAHAEHWYSKANGVKIHGE
jgi:hypothetical protein